MKLRWLILCMLSLTLFGGAASASPQPGTGPSSYVATGTIPGLGSAHVVGYTIFGASERAYAVGFTAKLDGVAGVSFCGDLLHAIGLGEGNEATPIDLSGLAAGYTTAAKIAQRWAFDLDSLGASLADAAAGVQLGIWRTIYGDDFVITSALGSGTKAAYDAVLATDYTNLGVGDTVFLDVTRQGVSRQDHFFTPNPPAAAPEPGAAFLFGAGLVIAAYSFRRSAA